MFNSYRVEFFNDQLEFQSAALVSAQQRIELDYLAFDAFSLETPDVTCEKGWFVHIVDGTTLIADGVVSDVEPKKNYQLVAVKPLQALFDVEVFASPIANVVQWLGAQITAQFINNADALQNRPIVVTATGTAGGLEMDGQTINLLEVMSEALTTYGIVCDCALDLVNMKVTVQIYKQTATAVLESDLPNVIERTVTLGDSYGAANKCIVQGVDSAGAVQATATYYLHPDGTVDTQNSNRITPVFWTLRQQSYKAEEFAEKAQIAAQQALTPKAFDNEIQLTYRTGDKIASPMEMAIGTAATIYVNGTAYNSLLTGRAIQGERVTLTFGQVRTALTKQLTIERRNSKE